MIKGRIIKNRGCRRFDQRYVISLETLKQLVDQAPLCGTARAGILCPNALSRISFYPEKAKKRELEIRWK